MLKGNTWYLRNTNTGLVAVTIAQAWLTRWVLAQDSFRITDQAYPTN